MTLNEFFYETGAGAIGAAITLFLALILNVRSRFEARRALGKKQHAHSIIVQVNHVVVGKKGRLTLLLRNVGITSIAEIFGNGPLGKIFLDLMKKSTLKEPWLPTQGAEAAELGQLVFNNVTAGCASAAFALSKFIVVITREPKDVTPREQIRVFLIREEDLRLFLHLNELKRKLQVETHSHWMRALTLHLIAKRHFASGGRSPFRTAELPVRSDYKPRSAVDIAWQDAEVKAILAKAGL